VTAAVASLIALLAAIALSMLSRINVGLVAIALAWLVGVHFAGLRPDAIMAGFPSSLFLTLVGVTFLFAIAEVNRSFESVVSRAVFLARDPRTLPLALFALAAGLSAVGPGAIASVALVIPPAMMLGARAQLPPLLTTLMVANGACAGNLSPISVVGIIANAKLADAGIVGHEGKVMLANFAAHALVAAAVYLFFVRRIPRRPLAEAASAGPLDGKQRLTLAVLLAWLVAVVAFGVHVGLSALVAGALLVAVKAADERAAIERIPWGVIVMVCGVSVLVALLERSGGMDLFTALLARIATVDTVNGTIAFVTGVISSYSSTSGVVLPAFLPTIPGLVEQLGGGDPLAIALSIDVGSSLVDVSPLSTLGAICVAAVPDPTASRRLFYQLFAWGLSMTLVGALLCQLFAGALARA
jgi:di/tricarboxylate transporter